MSSILLFCIKIYFILLYSFIYYVCSNYYFTLYSVQKVIKSVKQKYYYYVLSIQYYYKSVKYLNIYSINNFVLFNFLLDNEASKTRYMLSILIISLI